MDAKLGENASDKERGEKERGEVDRKINFRENRMLSLYSFSSNMGFGRANCNRLDSASKRSSPL